MVDGVATTRLLMQTDLTQIADRLEGFLRLGDNRRRAQGWINRAPMRLWLDDTGLTRRISYAPLPTSEPFWRTLELSDFGAAVDRPALAS